MLGELPGGSQLYVVRELRGNQQRRQQEQLGTGGVPKEGCGPPMGQGQDGTLHRPRDLVTWPGGQQFH